ncbi:MAG TPA: ISL3 family transposase [Clostridia bacterium]|nr:ISL3 family transposase [Clostridia bacterium]
MLQLSALFPPDLSIDDIIINDSDIIIRLLSTKPNCKCPNCGRTTSRVHSQYQRTLKDLPVTDKKTVICLQTRKFFCDNPDCDTKIFTERFKSLIKSYARKTDRLNKYLEFLGFAVSAEVGSILSKQILADVSPDSLLRLIKQTEQAINTDCQYIGIDDWAIRKGHKYCTLICDLVTKRPIDILPDRSYETVSGWLRKHPEIKIISMDRSAAYISAAKKELPKAKIVLDRFHIVHNLGQTLMKHLQSQFPNGIVMHLEPPKEEHPQATEKQLSKQEKRQLELYDRKWELIQEVHRLHQSHHSVRRIAKITKLARATVIKYLNIKEKPIPARTRRGSILDKYKPMISEALQKNLGGPDILEKIREQGYEGSASLLRMYIADVRRNREGQSCHSGEERISRKQLYSLLFWDPDKLPEKDKGILSKLIENPELVKIYTIVQDFKKAIKTRDIKLLENWINENLKSATQGFSNFTKRLLDDIEPVRNALLYDWSNGPLEGNINRIKMIKRTMYGRVGFDLLRKKVLFSFR